MRRIASFKNPYQISVNIPKIVVKHSSSHLLKIIVSMEVSWTWLFLMLKLKLYECNTLVFNGKSRHQLPVAPKIRRLEPKQERVWGQKEKRSSPSNVLNSITGKGREKGWRIAEQEGCSSKSNQNIKSRLHRR